MCDTLPGYRLIPESINNLSIVGYTKRKSGVAISLAINLLGSFGVCVCVCAAYTMYVYLPISSSTTRAAGGLIFYYENLSRRIRSSARFRCFYPRLIVEWTLNSLFACNLFVINR